MKRRTTKRLALASALATFLITGTAWAAFQPLDGQVNDDPAAGINPALGVNLADPASSDVVGGSLAAGGKPVPWGIFTARTGVTEQVFVRSFANGAWTTRGIGTVGGRSSASPTFPGSLNFQQNGNNPEAPAIDFAGAGRVVPWATWYEDNVSNFGANQVFASRFDNTGDANQNKWIFGGQGRGLAGGTVPVPSLNIHTGRDAENPVVAGGATVAGNNPGPWVTWQEIGNGAPGTGKDQIFVSKPLGPGQVNCDGIKPLGVNDGTGHVPAVGGFCWNQVGIDRLAGGDPSLNVDRTRDGVEPDIAFTGTNDTVPWVVWYEQNNSAVPGLHNNEMVFAAKGTPNASADGGFQWTAVGTGGTGVLDNSGTGGPCTAGVNPANGAAEAACSLNKNGAQSAEDPRVAAGTMTPGQPTVPWVVWDENVGAGDTGPSQVFVARLVNNGANFELANNGAPISIGSNPSTRPDITFSGNTPYVSWRENTGGSVDKLFVGHFTTPDSFVLDTPGGIDITNQAAGDVREPISSGCTADPFSQDGAACQGGAVGTPFFLFANGDPVHNIFGDAYQSDPPVTDAATGVGITSATLNGHVNPEGGPVTARFDFGPTTSYGQTTATQRISPANADTPFSAQITGQTSGTTVHYRAVVNTDFGSQFGADQVLKTTAQNLKLKVRHTTLKALLRSDTLKVKATENEAAKLLLTGKAKLRVRHHGTSKTKLVKVFEHKTVRFTAAGTKTAKLSLTPKGHNLLKHLSKVKLVISGKATDAGGKVAKKSVTVTLRRH